MISWVSFFLNREATQARVAIGNRLLFVVYVLKFFAGGLANNKSLPPKICWADAYFGRNILLNIFIQKNI